MGIPAFGKIHHLNMTQNDKLLTKKFRIEIVRKNGKKFHKRNTDGNCYFHGNTEDDNTAMASMSTCYGQLVSSIIVIPIQSND